MVYTFKKMHEKLRPLFTLFENQLKQMQRARDTKLIYVMFILNIPNK